MTNLLRKTSSKNVQDGLKAGINKFIKNISVIVIFVVLAIVLLLYIGPEIEFNASLVFGLAVPSIILAIGNIITYELWWKNGRRNAADEQEYQTLLKEYQRLSTNLHYPTMQEFLDAERERRYLVEYDRISRIIKREEELITKMEKVPEKSMLFRQRIRWAKARVKKAYTARDTIRIDMPYEKSEEFDYLRYNEYDNEYKEFKPRDARRHARKNRITKYSFVITLTIVGLNTMMFGSTWGNVWVALVMTALAAAALLFTLATGFANGYHNIKVISTGIYNTGCSFITQAQGYCERKKKQLYYVPSTIRPPVDEETDDDLPSLDGTEFDEPTEEIGMEIFASDKEVR